MNTPPRSVRIPADLWEAARATAGRRGETVTDIIVKALRGYVHDFGRTITEMPVEELEALSNAANRIVRDAGVNTIADLISYSEADLRSLPGMSAASVRRVEASLAAWGLTLRPGLK